MTYKQRGGGKPRGKGAARRRQRRIAVVMMPFALSLLATAGVTNAAFAQKANPAPQPVKAGRPLVPYLRDSDGAPVDYIRNTTGISRADSLAIQKALQHRDKMPPTPVRTDLQNASGAAVALKAGTQGKFLANGTSITNSTGVWRELGPDRYADVNGFAVAGRVNQVSFAAPASFVGGFTAFSSFYMATAGGGIWKASRGLDQFGFFRSRPQVPSDTVQALSDQAFPFQQTSSVAVNPTNLNMIFVGMGDYNTNNIPVPDPLYSYYNRYSVGIMKSLNGGLTWVNVGNSTIGNFPPGTTPPTIMEGTAVSAITVNPELPTTVIATSGRGVNPGGLWVSNDSGNSWTRGLLTTGGNTPSGNWCSLDFSAPDSRLGQVAVGRGYRRAYYAALENGGGVYRSNDLGRTWFRLNSLPLVYGLNPRVAVSKRDNNQQVVYVMDPSATNRFNPGRRDTRVFKSIDGGTTWTDISDVIDIDSARPDHAAAFVAALAPVTKLNTNGTTSLLTQDMAIAGSSILNYGLGAVNTDNSIIANPFGGTPFRVQDTGVFPFWTQPFDIIPYSFVYSYAQDPVKLSFGGANGLLATNIGVYRTSTTPGFFQSAGANNLPTTFNQPVFSVDVPTILNPVNPDVGPNNINAFLANSQVRRIDVSATNTTAFVRAMTDDQETAILVASGGVTQWSSLKPLLSSEFGGPYTNADELVNDLATTPNPTPIPSQTKFNDMFLNRLDNLAGDPNDGTLRTEYAILRGNGPWSRIDIGKRIFLTRNNWGQGAGGANPQVLDITPDRYLSNGYNGGVTAVALNGVTRYVFNTIDPQTASIATDWASETRPLTGMPIAFGKAGRVAQTFTVPTPGGYQLPTNPLSNNSNVMYTGGQYLWRYDPPGSQTYPPQPGAGGAATIAPNQDRGYWRRMGGQLATGSATISAIYVVQGNPNTPFPNNRTERIYVTTTAGDIWFTQNAQAINGGAQDTPSTTTWTAIAKPSPATGPITGVITSISNNPLNADDIIITYGDGVAAGQSHVWRTTNGGQNWFPINGTIGNTSFAFLPDVPINRIVRDPEDLNNTFFVATDIGVFTSVDAGSTWTNATAPLKLPNIACTDLKIVGTGLAKVMYVATYGRGVWSFDLGNLALANAKPFLRFSQYTLTRNSTTNEITLNATIENSQPTVNGVTPPTGPAYSARVTSITLQTDTGQAINGYITTAATPVSTANPVQVGNIAPNGSAILTVRFNAAQLGASGTPVTLRANGDYFIPPIPPGTRNVFSNSPGLRTRLP